MHWQLKVRETLFTKNIFTKHKYCVRHLTIPWPSICMLVFIFIMQRKSSWIFKLSVWFKCVKNNELTFWACFAFPRCFSRCVFWMDKRSIGAMLTAVPFCSYTNSCNWILKKATYKCQMHMLQVKNTIIFFFFFTHALLRLAIKKVFFT